MHEQKPLRREGCGDVRGGNGSTNILSVLFLLRQKLKAHRDNSQNFVLPHLEHEWESYSSRYYGGKQTTMIFKEVLLT